MEEMARDFRKQLGVSASVLVRNGTMGGKKELWSLQLGGKLSNQAKDSLALRGVTKVKIL